MAFCTAEVRALRQGVLYLRGAKVALDTFVAGRYSGTYNAVDVGITRDGYELTLDTEFEDIGETDAWGMSVIDGIWRGGNCFLQFTSVAYKPGSLSAFWPYGTGLGGVGALGILYDSTQVAKLPIAALASAIALPFILTSTPGTPAATGAGPAASTLTATTALLAKNNNGKLAFNSKLRDVPVRLRCYPFTTANITKFFATT